MNDWDWLREKDDEARRQRAEQLREVKPRALRDGKEPFDWAKLIALYDPSSEMSSSSELHDAKSKAEELEAKYYLDFPAVKTVAEFAECLNDLRSWG